MLMCSMLHAYRLSIDTRICLVWLQTCMECATMYHTCLHARYGRAQSFMPNGICIRIGLRTNTHATYFHSNILCVCCPLQECSRPLTSHTLAAVLVITASSPRTSTAPVRSRSTSLTVNESTWMWRKQLGGKWNQGASYLSCGQR